MILEGVTITIVGMAIVFVFLVILVFAMNALFRAIKRLRPDTLVQKPPSPDAQTTGDPLPKIAVAIALARQSSLKAQRG